MNRIKYQGLTKKNILNRLQITLQVENIDNTVMEIEKDCTSLLTLDIGDFLAAVYRELLEREPDNFNEYIRLMCQGMPHEAVIYLIASTQEFADRFKIKNLDNYKKIYKKFILKSKIKKLPIIGWYLMLRHMSDIFTELRTIYVSQRASDKILNQKVDAAIQKVDNANQKMDATIQKVDNSNQKMDFVIQKVDNANQKMDVTIQKVDDANQKMDSAIQKMDDANQKINSAIQKTDDTNQKVDSAIQKIDNANSKIDEFMALPSIPNYLVVNGLLDKDSYLKHANSILSDTSPEQLVKGNYYQLLEAMFRGSEESIRKHQQYYIDYMLSNTGIRKAKGKYFLDVGCGRGELLNLLQEHNITSVGIDINKISIDSLKKKGLTVYCSDILKYLEKIKDNELTGLSSFQVIEHLSKEYVNKLIETAYKKITNGGVILLETLNPYCYTNQEWFYIDPTHISWHSPDNLKLYLEYIGFCDVKIIYSAPVQPQYASKIDMMRNYIQFAVVASVKKS